VTEFLREVEKSLEEKKKISSTTKYKLVTANVKSVKTQKHKWPTDKQINKITPSCRVFLESLQLSSSSIIPCF
jgi:hypothetical protein